MRNGGFIPPLFHMKKTNTITLAAFIIILSISFSYAEQEANFTITDLIKFGIRSLGVFTMQGLDSMDYLFILALITILAVLVILILSSIYWILKRVVKIRWV
jgi:ABC-type proline/glycine betaine transport system permease subunit